MGRDHSCDICGAGGFNNDDPCDVNAHDEFWSQQKGGPDLGHVLARRVPANAIRAGDRIWTHNAFRAVKVATLDDRGVYIEFEAPDIQGGVYATVQEPTAFMLALVADGGEIGWPEEEAA